MMIRFLALLCLSCFSVGTVASCSSSKPAGQGTAEYDMATGTWQPTSHVVVPQKTSQPDDENPKDGILTKVGHTLKKPLQWLPWHKEEAQTKSD